jgi:hypothetical protein
LFPFNNLVAFSEAALFFFWAFANTSSVFAYFSFAFLKASIFSGVSPPDFILASTFSTSAFAESLSPSYCAYTDKSISSNSEVIFSSFIN